MSTNGNSVNKSKKLGDILLLNLLWILFSLPVVTIGAATCAAYYVGLKIVDNEQENVFQTFKKGFVTNLKQGTIIWIINAAMIYGSYYLWIMVLIAEETNYVLIGGALLLTAITAIITIYIYPVIARYSNSLVNLLRNAFGIAVLYLFQTFFFAALLAGEVFLVLYRFWTIPIAVLIVPVIMIYIISKFTKMVFLKIENNEIAPRKSSISSSILDKDESEDADEPEDAEESETEEEDSEETESETEE